ncbi:COX15/CtaA family protein [Neobacillus sp. SM06]|uniref:COX15/CtaA family protein n=1 Tax=Neobacillus sp. SM06 TaxID=3422492 RepID=UPI003D2E3751
MKNKFSLFTVLMTIVALIIGNLVVATNSGDACGSDWPKCNGTFFPNITNGQILVEYSHRIFTTLLGFVILLNAIFAWFQLRKKKTKWLAVLSFFLLGLQSIVGGLNVLLGTPVGFTFFDVTVSLLLLISVIDLHYALVNQDGVAAIKQGKSSFFKSANFILLFIMLETLIGAIFKHPRFSKLLYGNYTGEVLINSRVLAQFLYFVHGFLGLALVLTTAYLMFLAFKTNQYRFRLSLLVAALVITTFFGFLTNALQLSPAASSFHMIFTIISISIAASISARERLRV